MRSKSCCVSALLAGLLAAGAFAQAPAGHVLSFTSPAKLVVKRSGTTEFRLQLKLNDGYHTNSHTPSEAYLIPLRLTWEAAPLSVASISYPKPKLEKYSFAEQPLSVFSGVFEIVTQFKPPATPAPGPGFATGKLRYQACNDKMCLPPKTLEIKLPLLLE
jgi:DsbC/DsbD-like thiol-disulfide interchange protein